MISFEAAVKRFFDKEFCLIVEPSQSFSSCITAVLKSLGVPIEQVVVAHKFDTAQLIIEEKKPKLVITEYEVGSQLGLALVEAQAEHHDIMKRLSIVVTSNTSDSAVAEAAEEDVDAFILKPFSENTFKEKIIAVLKEKMDPSLYTKTIQVGKGHFNASEFSMAADKFTEAKGMDEKPTLACFYLGKTYEALGDVKLALASYREGRRHQPLHYRCLVGEFEGLMREEKYKEAYTLVPVLRQNYPITSHRLGQIFTAAVFTHHFDDLEMYYKLYMTLENRPRRLTDLSSLALLTAGRFFLKKNEVKKSMEAFDMGVSVSMRNIAFIEKVILDLVKYGQTGEVQHFLNRILPSDIGTAEYNRLSFRLDALVLSPEQLIEKGRKIIASGEASTDIFETVVRSLALVGKKLLAENIIQAAVKSHPDMRTTLYGILEENLKAS